jgi:hypothetical protein
MTTIFTLEGPADTIAQYYSYFMAMGDLAIIQPEWDREEPFPQYYVEMKEINEGAITDLLGRAMK